MTPLRAQILASLPWLDHGFGTRADRAWTPAAHTARLHQVHEDTIVTANSPGHLGDGDALITAVPALWLEIRTADCVPLLFVDPRLRIVAAVHAGWRGTAARIAATTVATFQSRWGTRPSDLLVAIGPSIAPCCFAVGEEVASHFPLHVSRTGPQPCVDLKASNREQVLQAGVPAAQIEILPHCTMCDPAVFHSFRRDRGEARMVSAIAIKPVSPPA